MDAYAYLETECTINMMSVNVFSIFRSTEGAFWCIQTALSLLCVWWCSAWQLLTVLAICLLYWPQTNMLRRQPMNDTQGCVVREPTTVGSWWCRMWFPKIVLWYVSLEQTVMLIPEIRPDEIRYTCVHIREWLAQYVWSKKQMLIHKNS